MRLRRRALVLFLLIFGVSSLDMTGVRVAAAQQSPLPVLSLHHPSQHNLCSEIGYKTNTMVTIPAPKHRTRRCREWDIGHGRHKLAYDCSGMTLHSWGFTAAKHSDLGYISVDDFSIFRYKQHNAGFTGTLVSTSPGTVVTWMWIDCDW